MFLTSCYFKFVWFVFHIHLTNIRLTECTVLRYQTYAKYCHQIKGAKLPRYKCLQWNLHMTWQQRGSEFTDVNRTRLSKRLCPGITWKVDFSCHPAKLQMWFMVSRTCSFLLQIPQRPNTTWNHSWQVLISIKISIYWSFKQPIVSCKMGTHTNSSSVFQCVLLSPLFAGMNGQVLTCIKAPLQCPRTVSLAAGRNKG